MNSYWKNGKVIASCDGGHNVLELNVIKRRSEISFGLDEKKNT